MTNPTDLSSHVDVEEDSLSERQKRLLLWRDYFVLLQNGEITSDKGSEQNPWGDKHVEVVTWLKVFIGQIEGDVMHIESGQEEYCCFDEVPDLREMSID